MHIAFRADASLQIGIGHVMRCLTLADEFAKRGAHCTFLCRPHAGHLLAQIGQRGHTAIALLEPQVDFVALADSVHAEWLGTSVIDDAEQTRQALAGQVVDCLVVDHYALDRQWEQMLRPHCTRLMAIDDLADRAHECDMLLDQNLGRLADDYCGLVPEGATLLTGPQFALLRPEFARLRPESLARRVRPTFKRLLISMGGVDKDNVTGRVLSTLEGCMLPEDLQITVVMGPKAPWLDEVRTQAALMRWPVEVLAGVSDMASLMVESDLAIGAAGGTSWERCCLGLPTLVLVLADNQKAGATGLEKIGAVLAVEHVDRMESILNKFLAPESGQEYLCELSRAASVVTDGAGVTRVCEQLMLPHG